MSNGAEVMRLQQARAAKIRSHLCFSLRNSIKLTLLTSASREPKRACVTLQAARTRHLNSELDLNHGPDLGALDIAREPRLRHTIRNHPTKSADVCQPGRWQYLRTAS